MTQHEPPRATHDTEREQEEIVLPVMEETVAIHKREIESGRVRIEKTVHERDVLVDEALMREQVDVERVAINRYVDSPPAVRHEGDTMIVPVVEEVLVIEKRLVLREELRVTRRREEVSAQQTVPLRREEVTVERIVPREADEQP
jgi:uncharacterized protein (TIGR02271 family)